MRYRFVNVVGPVESRRAGSRRPRKRAFRLTLILAAVFTLNAFDYAFTESQRSRGNFWEANVLAAAAVAHSPGAAAAYKVILFGAGMYIFYRLRRHRVAETGAWVLLGCHVALTGWWLCYLHAVEHCPPCPFSDSPPMLY